MKRFIKLLVFILFFCFSISINAQITHTGNNRTGSDFIGVNSGSNGPLDIRNDLTCSTCSLDFYINTTHYLQLQASGDLNVVQGANGYKIGTNYVLRHNNIPTSIFVGIESGFSTPTTTGGVQNTYVGYKSGRSTTSGYDNTILGYTAGQLTSTGFENCFIGSYAGHDNVLGQSNVFIGFKAGEQNDGAVANKGSWNTIVGFKAGSKTYRGNANCFYGKYSGDENKKGNNNSFYGSHSGRYR